MGLFTKKGWDKVPKVTVEHIRNKIGVNNFEKLTQLLETYKIFNNKTFNKSDDFKWMFPFLLSRLGTVILANSGNKQDAEFILQTAIALEETEPAISAHSSIAFLYFLEDKKDLAKTEAKIALEIDNKISDEARDIVDKQFLNREPIPNTQRNEYRDNLQSIIDGTLKKEDINGE